MTGAVETRNKGMFHAKTTSHRDFMIRITGNML